MLQQQQGHRWLPSAQPCALACVEGDRQGVLAGDALSCGLMIWFRPPGKVGHACID